MSKVIMCRGKNISYDLYCVEWDVKTKTLTALANECCGRASVLDHSCRPNAVAVFSGTTLQVRCIRPISNAEPVRL